MTHHSLRSALLIGTAVVASLVAAGGAAERSSAYLIPVQWTHPAVAGPAARTLATMAFDPRGVEILFGGSVDGSTNGVNDTWQYGAGQWTQLAPAQSPPGRVGAVMAYDPNLQQVILFGGFVNGAVANDTWAWDGSNWHQVQTTQAPPPRALAAMSFDGQQRQQLILFGGSWLPGGNAANGLLGDTWTFNGDWHQQFPSYQPAARAYTALASDSSRNVTVLYGGYNGSVLDDTWEWSGLNWLQRFPVHTPGGREQHTMVFDRVTNEALTFGGIGPFNSVMGDTWGFDGGDWNQAAPGLAPPARTLAAMAYDLLSSTAVMFGGVDSSQPGGRLLSDTWQLALGAPVFTASPAAVDFGNVDVGVVASRTVTVSNTGSGVLNIGTVTVVGTDASFFPVTRDTCSNASVAAGTSCAVTLGFTSPDGRHAAAWLSFPANASCCLVQVTGHLAIPFPVKTPTSFEFGSVPVGASASTDFALGNVGDGNLFITRIYAQSGNFATSSNCPLAPLGLGPGATCTIHVTFTPAALGRENTLINVLDNLPPGYEFYSVGGIGVATPVALTARPAGGVYGGAADVTVSAATPGGMPLAGLPISLTLPGGTAVQATTDGGGTATFPGLSLGRLGAGSYPSGIAVSYAGDATHSAATAATDLTVTPAPLTVTVADATREYGAASPAFTFTTAGLVTGDSVATLGTPTYATTATATTEVGVYPITVTGLGSANYAIATLAGTLHITPAAVSLVGLTASAVAPNTAIEFSDSARFSVTLGTVGGVLPRGLVTFSLNGHQLPSVPATSGVTTATVRLDGSLIPGAGGYTLAASFAPADADFATGGAATTVNVAREGAALSYNGELLVYAGAPATLSILIDQRSPAADVEYMDFALVPVWVRFDVTGHGTTTTFFAAVTDAADWSSTGRGQARVNSGWLPIGAYSVSAHLVAASGSAVAAASPYLAAVGVRAGLAVSPTVGSYAAAGGFVATDPAAAASDPRGYFALVAVPRNGGVAGSANYSYRAVLNEGGVPRDVDVVMASTSLTGFAPAANGGATFSGTCTLTTIDSSTGQVYGTPIVCRFAITGSPATASTPAHFAVSISAGGTVLHSASGAVAGGSIRVHP